MIGQAFLERVLWQWSGSQVGEAHTGAAEGPLRDCCRSSRRNKEAVIQTRGSREAGEEASGRHKGGRIYWLVALAGRVEKMQPGMSPKGLSWVSRRPKTQLIDIRNSEERAGGGWR